MDSVSAHERGIDPNVGDRRIEGQGTPERDWLAWNGLALMATIEVEELVPDGSRAVIVAPHPDDEVLACGGLLALLAIARRQVLVVGVTDGEASHPGSSMWTPKFLAQCRRQEREKGLTRLDPVGRSCPTLALGLPDGRVALHERQLLIGLELVLRPSDVMFATWRLDGHPDHEAVGRVAIAAAREHGLRCWEMPVWAWHWGTPADPRIPWSRMRRLALDATSRSRKRSAIAAHETQLLPSTADGLSPILPDWALARLLRPFEVFIEGGFTA